MKNTKRLRPEWLGGPVKKRSHRYEPGSGFSDAYILRFPLGHGVVLDDGGSNRDTEAVLDEVVKRYNVYDALVEACEAHLVWENHSNRCSQCGIMGIQCSTAQQLERQADGLVREALALVRGEEAE